MMQPSPTPRMAPSDWACLVLLSILWGGSFFFSKIAVQVLPPFTVVLVRVGLAALALRFYLAVSGIAVPRGRQVWLAFAGMGLLNNVIPFALIFWGQQSIASGLASILNATTPVFSILVAHALTQDERITPAKLAGVALGIAGVVLLMGADALHGSQRSLLAMLACLGAALSYGFASVFGRRFRRMGIAPATGAFGQVCASTALMLPVALAADQPWRLPLPALPVWGALAGLALLSTALAYVLFFRILGRAGATNISLVTLLVPVSAILLGGLILGERLTPAQFGGMALIALGLVAIDGRALTALRRAPPRTA
jgi:drug/metabolite transporter (DMT)-like permease